MMRLAIICLPLFFAVASCREDSYTSTMEPVKTASTDEFVRTRVEYAPVEDTLSAPKFLFDQTEFLFDTVAEGSVVRHNFTFINAGRKPLIIYDARTSCGCTVPQYPEEAIAPGDSSVIRVEFNTRDKAGFQDKPIILIANTYPRRTVLNLRGHVEKQKNIQ